MENKLKELFSIIEERKKNPKKGSYTNSLFEEGETKIISKILEESSEVVKAAYKEGNQRLIEEIDDLVYHIFVLMVQRGLTFEDLEKEEKKRMK
jgi:phosphoribosyl-ATP pyrophosphohydrolase